ncbi:MULTISPECIES: hypothetical protein [unclassified Streptomyces]|uniref:hypothetical protein n=1 Tax=unclassified Streptomyces TaxID=2593676 RepID=UPI000360ABE0|nr:MULTISPECIES: hypothetical protein [unclassified Streptomyces]MYY05065.1 hypothetical protein [Streptomyces sp. SID4913]
MRIKRSLGAAAVLATAVTALAVPQAEAGQAAPAPASVQAKSPTVSPSTGHAPIYNDAGLISCQVGSLCTAVWDPARGQWRVDRFEKCGTYYLSYWEGAGTYINNQTGGAVGKFIRADETSKKAPADNKSHPINWSEFWSIKPC